MARAAGRQFEESGRKADEPSRRSTHVVPGTTPQSNLSACTDRHYLSGAQQMLTIAGALLGKKRVRESRGATSCVRSMSLHREPVK